MNNRDEEYWKQKIFWGGYAVQRRIVRDWLLKDGYSPHSARRQLANDNVNVLTDHEIEHIDAKQAQMAANDPDHAHFLEKIKEAEKQP